MSDSTQGNGAPGAPQGTASPDGANGTSGGDAPKYVTEEQLNKAITARFKSFETKVDKSFADFGTNITTSFTSKFDEVLSSKLDSLKPPAQAADDKGGKGKGGSETAPTPFHETPEWKALQKQLADQQKIIDGERKEKEALKTAERERSLRSAVAELAGEKGLDAKRAKHLIHSLVDGEKRIRWADDGQSVVFRADDGEDVPLKDGLEHFFKTDEGKFFLPPSGAAGSGGRPGGSAGAAPPPNQKPTREQMGEMLLHHLTGQPAGVGR